MPSCYFVKQIFDLFIVQCSLCLLRLYSIVIIEFQLCNCVGSGSFGSLILSSFRILPLPCAISEQWTLEMAAVSFMPFFYSMDQLSCWVLPGEKLQRVSLLYGINYNHLRAYNATIFFIFILTISKLKFSQWLIYYVLLIIL